MAHLARQLRYQYLALFSKPVADRILYRHIWRHRCHRILELGVGTAARAQRLIEVATLAGPGARISYSGVDLFEMRGQVDGPGVSLKLAHRQFQATGARVRLLPGDPYSVLSRTANSLGPHDLVLISADQPQASLSQAWFYFPRILAPGAVVFRHASAGEASDPLWRVVSAEEIERLSQPPPRRRVA